MFYRTLLAINFYLWYLKTEDSWAAFWVQNCQYQPRFVGVIWKHCNESGFL